MINVTTQQKRALSIATVLAIVFGAYFLKHYTMLVIFAAIVAFIFNPFYQRMLRKRKPSAAAMLTLLASIVAIIIPLTIVLALTAHQLANLIDVAKNISHNTNLTDLLNSVIDSINNLLSSLGVPYKLSESAIISNLGDGIKSFAEGVLGSLTSIASGIGSFISTSIIYIYVFMSLLINQDKLLETFHQLNPLGRDVSNLYARRTAVMTKAMVRGQFIIATVQGFTDAALLYIAGLRSLFFFFFVLLTMLSIIPLGGGIVAIPIGIVMILTGHVWQGLLVVLGHLLIVTNEDNVLRPKLVPKEARLDPALTLLSVFSGLAFFGFIGIVLGPVIMILIVTTLQVYLDVYRKAKTVKSSVAAKKA